jgi:hypothetical protein
VYDDYLAWPQLTKGGSQSLSCGILSAYTPVRQSPCIEMQEFRWQFVRFLEIFDGFPKYKGSAELESCK